MGFFTRFFCTHKYKLVRTIHGDEINHRNGLRSEWKCIHCDKVAFSKCLTYLKKKKK